MSSRNTLRKKIATQRRLLSKPFIELASKQIMANVLGLPEVQHAHHIAGYFANNGEVDPMPICETLLAQQKFYYLPTLDPNQTNHLVFVNYRPGDPLILNRYKIPEPYVLEENIPVGLQDARLGAEFTRDLNYFELENPKEYSLYFEGFPIQNNLKVDLKSDASSRILKSDRYIRPPQALDIVLMPLVAFDKQGGRLGMGGGYYDRTFAFTKQAVVHKPLLIGLAYAFQCVDQLDCEEWDVPLDRVVTEEGVYGPSDV